MPGRISFQISVRHAVRLPESFRGGCSFGADRLFSEKRPISPDATSYRCKAKHGIPALSTRPPDAEYTHSDDNLPTFGPFVDKAYIPRLKAAWQNGTLRGMVPQRDSGSIGRL
jgi:hypothetical protein